MVSLPGFVPADLRLDFDVVQLKMVSDGEETREIKESEYPLTLFLGEDYIEYRDRGDSRIIDFQNGRIYDISVSDKSYSDISLYSEIGFRVRELPNRLSLGGELARQGLVEHLFSLKGPDSRKPDAVSRRFHREYSYEGTPLLDLKEGGERLTRKDAERYGQFLRYHSGVHPDILRDLESVRIVAPSFDLYRYDVDNNIYNFTFTGMEEVERSYHAENRMNTLQLKEDRLSALISAADGLNQEAVSDEIKLRAVESAQAGKMFESFLLFLEYTVASGKPMPPEFLEYEEKIGANTEVRLLVASLTPGTEHRKGLALNKLRLASMRAGSGIHAVLMVQGNLLASLGRFDEAEEILTQVLLEKPHMVFLWKDLGDIYYAQYNMVDAWRCWDAGRKLLPDHQHFASVNELEKKLREDHPEFFLP